MIRYKHTENGVRVVGIDPSTYTGMICLEGTTIKSSVVNFPLLKGMDRLCEIESRVRELLADWQPSLVVIEGYGMSNKFTLCLMVEIGSLIRMILHKSGVPWYYVPPTVLKKFATGSGAAKKPQIAAAVKKRWGFDAPSDDLVDAFVLAQIARTLVSDGVSTVLKGVERG